SRRRRSPALWRQRTSESRPRRRCSLPDRAYAWRVAADAINGGSIVAGAEYGRPGHNHVRAGSNGERRMLGILAAIDFDPGVKPLSLAQSPQGTDLRRHLRQELLPAKSGIDGHDQDDVAKMQDLLDKSDGACRIEHRTARLSKRANARQHAMQVDGRRRFGLHQQMIGAGLGEIVE